MGDWHRGNVGEDWSIMDLRWFLFVVLLATESSFLNCCKEVKDGNTDGLRLRWSAAFRSVVSEMLRDIPRPPDFLEINSSAASFPAYLLSAAFLPLSSLDGGKGGGNRLVGVGGGLVWAPPWTRPSSLGFLGGCW